MCVVMFKYGSEYNHTVPVNSKSSHVVSNGRFKSLLSQIQK